MLLLCPISVIPSSLESGGEGGDTFHNKSHGTCIITNKNGKYELTDELPNDVRLKKISKLHKIIVSCPVFFPQ